MAARKKQKLVNLLPKEEFASSTLGRVLKWLLSSFRVIVIVTEMIVMGAFLSRFWLDAKSADLTDEVRQKQSILIALSEFENDFKDVQKKLSIISGLEVSNINPQENLDIVSSLLPQDVYLSAYGISNGTIKISGISPSERSVAQLLANLKSHENFSDVSLSQLGSAESQTSLLLFEISINPNNLGGST